jgi:hypothetical protein
MILPHYFVEIIYRSHLDITSIVGTSSIPIATALLSPVAEALKLLASIHPAAESSEVLGNPHTGSYILMR